MTSIGNNDPLFGTTWVHLFEKDTPDGAVYVPEDDPIPLSRRPRERLAIEPDGSARFFMPGPDDRPVERSATWTQEQDDVVIRTREGGGQFRIFERSPHRLVIKMPTKP